MKQILIGGAAGDGVETMSLVLEKLFKLSGYHVFTLRDAMSRIRGGHNFVKLRLGSEPIMAAQDKVDLLVPLNQESYNLHCNALSPAGVILADSSIVSETHPLLAFPFQQMAQVAGNNKTVTTAIVGAILGYFGIKLPMDKITAVLTDFLPESVVQVNQKAFLAGQEALSLHVELTKPQDLSDYMLLSGNTALCLGALAAGMNFYSAYPMSPATSILTYLDTHKEALRIVVEQAEDEIAAVNMALGAAAAGGRAMAGTSGGGFSLMVEALGFAGIAEIPVVLVDVQRPGPATGLPTRTEQSDLAFVVSASQGEFPRMVIALSDHEDAITQTQRAFALAWHYQIPVIILSDQYLADSSTLVHRQVIKNLPDLTAAFSVAGGDEPYMRYALTDNGISPLSTFGTSGRVIRWDSDEHDERGVITEAAEVRKAMVDKRLKKQGELAKVVREPEFFGSEEHQILLIGFGSTKGAIKEAITILNQEQPVYGALCFGDIYPLPQAWIDKYHVLEKEIVSVEQNATGQLAALIRRETGVSCSRSCLKYDGRPMLPAEIIQMVKGGAV